MYIFLIIEGLMIGLIIILKMLEWVKAINLIKKQRGLELEKVREDEDHHLDKSEYCTNTCFCMFVFILVVAYEAVAYFILPIYYSDAQIYLYF